MSENNYEQLQAECEARESANIKRLHNKLAVAFKNLTGCKDFVTIEELPVCKSQKRGFVGTRIQPFSINIKDNRVGYYEMFIMDYKDAVKGKEIKIYTKHIENYLPIKKIA